MKSHPIAGLTPGQRTWRHIKGGILILLLIAFACWASWWWLILLPLLIDFYFTRWINWRYLREHPNPTVRLLGGLVEDIIFVVFTVSSSSPTSSRTLPSPPLRWRRRFSSVIISSSTS